MKKNLNRIISFIIFIVIIFLIVLPLLEHSLNEFPFLGDIKLYFSSDSNKSYFEVMLSVITVLTTFQVFYWQNQIEINNKNKEIKQEKEKQEQLYLEQREREHAVVRPLFLVELQGKNSVIKLFLRESAPLTNITVYYQNVENESFQEEFVGNAVSGDCIFRFDSDKLESAIIECRTYLEEQIYFQYHVGNNLIHYRVVDGEDLSYISGVLKRRILNNIVENSLNHVIEIYHIQLQHSLHESIFFNKFIDFFSTHKQYWRTAGEDKLFKLSVILGEDNIEAALSQSIGLDSKQNYKQTPEIFTDLLTVINKYLKDVFSTNCEEAPKEREYFIGNIVNYRETEIGKYIEIFRNEPIDRETITKYIDDLIVYLKREKQMVDFPLRIVEVYLKRYVTVSKAIIGYSNEVEYVKTQIRNDLREVFSKYI
ncbi:hypothetical protein [Streptococcus suis]|uniref:Uncharacterized protein n=3 Tax=Streptococcus suis TaxID=1307 RepID=A0A0Z8TNA0_STRSU|nr:hypothetical protein [Streptococcus suis]AWL25457.1 hypothetical protein DF184_02455 [Streptococcus suis]MCO8204392.1 hypothetical protein [Streptococcus suis]NQG21304.1 hypothetical protein [Streptococcus suis]NQG45267.1 hypothetical protein [Streptococcus suis]NQH16043.1 hypothetical protein [Streptococcus suis]